MILERETYEQFGYYPSDLSPHSGKKILVACDDCGRIREVSKQNYVRNRTPFCKSCAKKGKRHPKWQGGLVKRICETCGKEFDVEVSEINRGFGRSCSPSCARKGKNNPMFGMKGENCPVWKGGRSFEPYCEKFNDEFREYIREKFRRVCFLCPTTEEENGQRLSVHHVNYNKDCGCDGDLTCQFVPLCRSCHSKVNFNREEWEAKIKDMMHNSLKGWYI